MLEKARVDWSVLIPKFRLLRVIVFFYIIRYVGGTFEIIHQLLNEHLIFLDVNQSQMKKIKLVTCRPAAWCINKTSPTVKIDFLIKHQY